MQGARCHSHCPTLSDARSLSRARPTVLSRSLSLSLSLPLSLSFSLSLSLSHPPSRSSALPRAPRSASLSLRPTSARNASATGTYPPDKLILADAQGAERGKTNLVVFEREVKSLVRLGAPEGAATKWLRAEATAMRAALP